LKFSKHGKLSQRRCICPASNLLGTQAKFSHEGRAVQLQATAITIGQPSILRHTAATALVHSMVLEHAESDGL
jgi:hypothetical protein